MTSHHSSVFLLFFKSFNFQVAEETNYIEGAYSTANMEDLCRCITTRRFVMYGVSSCSHCQHQKQLLDAGFSHIVFHECDQECVQQLDIKGYPTWISFDSEGNKELARFVGVLRPDELANITGCPYTSS